MFHLIPWLIAHPTVVAITGKALHDHRTKKRAEERAREERRRELERENEELRRRFYQR